jgi:S-formylglutathione hydrolase FrmB
MLVLNGCVSGSATEQARAGRESLRFVVSFPEKVHPEPLTGRVLLFFCQSADWEPRYASEFSSEPVYAIDVNNLGPQETVVFSPERFRIPDALAFPGPLDRLEAGTYYVQALIDIDTTRPGYDAPGNLYSPVAKCELPSPKWQGVVELIADQVLEDRPPYEDTDRVKLVEIRSELLSDFHGHEVDLRAGVVLPSAYDEDSNRQFPVLYTIPGFGGDHTGAWWSVDDVKGDMLRVVLDPTVPLGHSHFANSANNGPVGDALVEELIPEIERRFRVIPHAYGRLVTGHSSGGWASLWLQVTYPDVFDGCWSLAPDPVDFTHFQTMNIYEDRNGHWTDEGYPRPLARRQGQVGSTFGQVNRREYVVGYGSHLDSFNAVFSPRGDDGRPRPIMDKLTGAIDREVAEYWKRYDIRQVLEENWMSLGPKLKGKLHVIGGGWDNFYLETAVEGLHDFLAKTDYQGYVEILPGNHVSFWTDELDERLDREMTEHFSTAEKAYLEAQSLSPETPEP